MAKTVLNQKYIDALKQHIAQARSDSLSNREMSLDALMFSERITEELGKILNDSTPLLNRERFQSIVHYAFKATYPSVDIEQVKEDLERVVQEFDKAAKMQRERPAFGFGGFDPQNN